MSATNNTNSTNNSVVVDAFASCPAKNKQAKKNNQQKVLVNVKRVMTNEEPIQVSVKLFGKVQQIKNKIKKELGIPVLHQVLIFAGKHLENAQRIVDLIPSTSLKELEINVFLVVDKTKKKPMPAKEDEASSPKEIAPIEFETKAPTAVSSEDEEIVPSSPSIVESPLPESSLSQPQQQRQQPVPLFNLPPSTRADAPVLKISFQENHRRVPFEGDTFAELLQLAGNLFGIKNTRRLVVQYKDEDGDLITISTDAEFAFGLQHHSTASEPKVFKILLSMKPLNKRNVPAVADVPPATDKASKKAPKPEKRVPSPKKAEIQRKKK